ALIGALLSAGYVPVIAPVGIRASGKPDEPPLILNINADLVAGEIAAAIGAERLIFLTDVVGICDQQGRLLPGLSASEAERLIASGVVSGGMIPKVRAGIRATSSAVATCIIDGRQPHTLLKEVEGANSGTTIRIN
ncbi:MAG: acetylglutamate kinase, partial [Dehalococcoidales bacterium]|nr:acetylglutamate kinase [Dehalococcoidales bacterium]